MTTFAEQEGSFTNVEGRVQRFWPALQAPGMARPAWLILGALAGELSDVEAPRSAAEAFALLAGRVDAFQGLTYEDLGTRGAVVNETVSLLRA
jgi:NADH-quinone oxidoreductase subunit G